jgi:UDP-N-acetylmuramoylalanine--D-glutamate ligase
LPELELAERAGVEVVGELELSARLIAAEIVAVGGTNGKSTTTTLLGDILKADGRRTFVGGNLGTPAAEATFGEWDSVVLEVSSFQLERAPRFHPRVSILLNVSEDHLDRYPSFTAYAEAKGRAFLNQTEADCAVVPVGDVECQRQAARGRGRLVTFGADADFGVSGRRVLERASGDSYDLERSELHGRHNIENAAAAIAAARALGVSPDAVRRGLAIFRPLPHRMALVGDARGIRFYDDSKGTNVGAAVTALSGLAEARAVLIAGGRDKHGSYEPLVKALLGKGRALVVIGEAAERIASAVAGRVPLERAQSMDEAVAAAFRLAEPGDAVLLSPACSSFDMFQSYADRGRRFADAVSRLTRPLEGALR